MKKLGAISFLISVEKLLRNKKFEEALVELRNIDFSNMGDKEYAYYCLLFSEISLWLGNLDAHIDNFGLQDIINKTIIYYKANYKVGGNDERYSHAKYLLGWLLTIQSNYSEAREVLLESYVSYQLCDKVDALPKVLNRLAIAQFQTGAVDDAIKNWRRCIDLSKKLKRYSNVILITRNIIVNLCVSGALKEAVKEIESIERNIEDFDDIYKIRFYHIYSLVNAMSGNFNSAHDLIARTAEISKRFKSEYAVYHEYLGWIYNLEGEFDKAVDILKTGIGLSNKIAPESDLISQSKRLLADAYIGLQKFDLAQETAEEALVVAEKIKERSEIAGCYRVFAQVAVHNGEKEKAIEYYKKAVDIFKLIQSRYELAVTRYLMAASGLFDNGERMALLYLAREYFVSEEIEHYNQKVDAAIKKYRSDVSSITVRTSHPMGPTQTVFIARHPKIRKIVEFAENVAESNMTVFLTGPTGSGKDHLAKYIHECSGRKGDFVTVNCAAIPETMIESELFGYRKGAFTGADQDRTGLFEAADGGTFYLNEIADASPVFQAKLLEVIEKKAIRRLGENKSRPVDVRIIAATNHDLEVRIKENKFRFDLYHRLNEIPITLPPLDDRKEDIAELVGYFLTQNDCDIKGDKSGLTELGRLLESRSWPGNVRELKAEIDRMCLTTKGDLAAMVEHLHRDQLSDRDLLLKTLEETGWNQSETARRLGIAESTVRAWIKKFNIIIPK